MLDDKCNWETDYFMTYMTNYICNAHMYFLEWIFLITHRHKNYAMESIFEQISSMFTLILLL